MLFPAICNPWAWLIACVFFVDARVGRLPETLKITPHAVIINNKRRSFMVKYLFCRWSHRVTETTEFSVFLRASVPPCLRVHDSAFLAPAMCFECRIERKVGQVVGVIAERFQREDAEHVERVAGRVTSSQKRLLIRLGNQAAVFLCRQRETQKFHHL